MRKMYLNTVKCNDGGVAYYRAMIDRNPDSINYGNLPGPMNMSVPSANPGVIGAFIASYACEDSKYYKSRELLKDIVFLCEYLVKVLHDDGTIDFTETNFYTTPMFELKYVGHGYKPFKDSINFDDPYEKSAFELFDKVYTKLADGCYNGGFHTPNHRWITAAALVVAYDNKGDQKYLDKANKYFAEGLEVNEYGEWAERSMGMYGGHCNAAMMDIYSVLPDEKFVEAARKNLLLTLRYNEPDGTVFTQKSTRVDKGEVSEQLFYQEHSNFIGYLFYAYLKKDNYFFKIAEELYDRCRIEGRNVALPLGVYNRFPEFRTMEPDYTGIEYGLLDTYTTYNEKTGIFRQRNKNSSFTLCTQSPNFLHVKNGRLDMYVRACASFFAVAQFEAQKIEQIDENNYCLTFTTFGDYYKVFDNPPPTSDWWEMDNPNTRERIYHLDLVFKFYFTFQEDRVLMRITSEGCEKVPFKIEFCVRSMDGIFIDTEGANFNAYAGGYATIKHGDISIQRATDKIEIKNAFATHYYTHNMRGSVAKPSNRFSLYFTDYTNFDRTIEIISRPQHGYEA